MPDTYCTPYIGVIHSARKSEHYLVRIYENRLMPGKIFFRHRRCMCGSRSRQLSAKYRMHRVIVHAAATFAADARQEKTARFGGAFSVM